MEELAKPGDKHRYAGYWRKREAINAEMFEATGTMSFWALARNCGLTAETGLSYERVCEAYGFPQEFMSFWVLAGNCGLTAETGLSYERVCEAYGSPHEFK